VSVTIPNINEVISSVDNDLFKAFTPRESAFNVRDLYRDLIIFKDMKRSYTKRF